MNRFLIKNKKGIISGNNAWNIGKHLKFPLKDNVEFNLSIIEEKINFLKEND